MQKGIIKNVNPVTGQTIEAKDLSTIFSGVIGETSGIVEVFENLDLEKVDNNTFKLKGGVYSLQGYILYIQKESYVNFTIRSGSTGTKRIDLLVAEYTKEGDAAGEDTLEFKIIQGTTTTGDVDPPEIISQEINSNGVMRQEVLYRIEINGVTATATRVASLIPNLQKLNEKSQLALDMFDGAGFHNSVYRGINLGSEVSPEQKQAISDGTFKDMFIGDYWLIGGVRYRIAAFNYFYNTGDTALTKNHVTIVPDTPLVSGAMNDTNTTSGGYLGSGIRSGALNVARNTIVSAFGNMLLKHRQILSSEVNNGVASNWEWTDSDVELMNEHMVYGSNATASSENPNGHRINVGTSKTQLPLFFYRPDLIGIRQHYWLRDVASATYFANVGPGGYPSRYHASNALGVRPAFSIS